MSSSPCCRMDAILRAVADELIPAMSKGARCFVDCSTVDVESARAVADQAAKQPGFWPSTPRSLAASAGPAAGTLTFMAGGS